MNYADVLHTKSDYAISEIGVLSPIKKQSDEIIMQRVISQIDALKDKELQLYKKFGCNSEDEFYDFIHNFFNNHKQDFDVISRFTATRLDKIIDDLKKEAPRNTLEKDAPITVVVQLEEKYDPDAIIKELQSIGLEPQSNGSELRLSTSLNVPVLKQIVNKTKGTHFQAKGTKDSKRNESTTLLYNFLEQNVVNGINVYLGNSTQEIDRVTFKTSFLQYNKDEITSMLALDLEKRYSSNRDDKYLVEALYNKIENFILHEMCAGGSNNLQNAARQVWFQKIGEKGYDGMVDFFTGGRNWERVLKGALGEFQVALFFQYLAVTHPELNLESKLTRLTGSDINDYKQQLHSDVKFLEMLGIQVKNFNSPIGWNFKTNQQMDRTVTVALHPSEIARIASDEEVVSYIVNSFFNRTFGESMGGIEQSKAYIISFFENYASELLNLEMNINNITVPDQVSFYMIGGRFVPGSAILNAAFLVKDNNKMIQILEPSLTGTKGFTDKDFNLDSKGKKAPPARLISWWHGIRYIEDSWHATQENNLNAWDKKVSIKTQFTYSAFWDNVKYNLFG